MLLPKPRSLRAQHDATHYEAREKVFNTIEILESILEYLPGKALFNVQRVNNRFHETIAGSSRIQRRMFLRIDDDRTFVWDAHFKGMAPTGTWYFKQVHNKVKHPKGWVTPVVLNPCFWRSPRTSAAHAFVLWSEELQLRYKQPLTLQQFEHQSIAKGYLSDSHCTAIQVRLYFVLCPTGFDPRKASTLITVCSVVRSQTPLTFGAIVSRALDSTVGINVLGAADPRFCGSRDARKEGVARELIDELKQQTNYEAFFILSESSFHLLGVVAPTDEERAAAKSD
jgi:hypothetical protein